MNNRTAKWLELQNAIASLAKSIFETYCVTTGTTGGSASIIPCASTHLLEPHCGVLISTD